MIDINPSYNFLLGRPPLGRCSTFHSTSKSQVCGRRESGNSGRRKRHDSATTTTAPYPDVKEDATECSFRSFEIATATKEESKALMSHLSQNTQMILRQTIGKGAKVGYGLRKDLQGRHMVISSIPKQNCYGIRYQSYNQKRNGRIQKENRMTKPYVAFPLLSWTFRSGGYINTTQSGKEEGIGMSFRALTIGVIIGDEEEDKSAYPAVYPYPSDSELDNWSAVEIPIAYKLSK